MRFFYDEGDENFEESSFGDNLDEDVVDEVDDSSEELDQTQSLSDRANGARNAVENGKKVSDTVRAVKNSEKAVQAASTAKNVGGFAKMLAPLLPYLATIGIIIAIIISVAGLIFFTMTMPGAIWDKVIEITTDFGNTIIDMLMGEQNNIKASEVAEVADNLDAIGYDLHAYGFVSDPIEKNGSDFKTHYGNKNIGYFDLHDFWDPNKREVDDNSLHVTGDGVLRDKDGIVYLESEPIKTYIMSDNLIYIIRHQNTSITDLVNSTNFSLGFIKDFFLNGLGRGLIGIYWEEYTGVMPWDGPIFGTVDLNNPISTPLNNVIDVILRMLPLDMGNSTVSFEINKENNSLDVISYPKGYWGSSQRMSYNLEGWTGRYGMPLEFLTALHLTSMQPDLAIDLVKRIDTEVQISTHSSNIDISSAADINGEKLTKEQMNEKYNELMGQYTTDYNNAINTFRAKPENQGKTSEEITEAFNNTDEGIALQEQYDSIQVYNDQTILADLDTVKTSFTTLIPYIYKVNNHWFRDVYFVDEDNDGFIVNDEDYEAKTGERWTFYEMMDSEGNIIDAVNPDTGKVDDTGVAQGTQRQYANGGLGDVRYVLYYYKDGELNNEVRYDGTKEDAEKDDSLTPEEKNSLHKKSLTFRMGQSGKVWMEYSEYEKLSDEEKKEYDGYVGGASGRGKWTAYRIKENDETGWEEYGAGVSDDKKNEITNYGTIYYKVSTKSQVEQIEDGQRGKTNLETKRIFSLNKYYIYDGTSERATAIMKDKNENATVKAEMEKYINGNDSLINTDNDPRDENLLGNFSVDRDSLSAFNILTSMGTMDADSIYRDFKELIVELNFFDKEDLTEVENETFEWPIPEIGTGGWPIRVASKKENEYGTLIHSKKDVDYLKERNLLTSVQNFGANDSGGGIPTSGPLPTAEVVKTTALVDKTDIRKMIQGIATNKTKAKGQSSRASQFRKDSWLETAKACWEYIVDGNYVYGAPSQIPVNAGGNTVDCSGYVSWVLYEYGYDIFAPWQHNTTALINNAHSGMYDEYGWEIIEVAQGENVLDKLQPGDILVRDTGKNSLGHGHTQIVKEINKGSGSYETITYDCGATRCWAPEYREGCPSNFYADPATDLHPALRPGIIIRIEGEPPKDEGDPYKGWEGGEYVVSPVTGVVLQAGTKVKTTNIETGKKEYVGFIKIRVLDEIDFNAVFGTSVKDAQYVEDSDESKDYEGFKYFANEYAQAEVAGNIFYMEGFSQELFDSGGDVGKVSVKGKGDAKNCYAETDDGDEIINQYTPYDYSKVISKKAREELERQEELRVSAVPLYENNGLILIKEGTVIGTTYSDDVEGSTRVEELLEEGLNDIKAEIGMEVNETTTSSSTTSTSSSNTGDEDDPLSDRDKTARPGVVGLNNSDKLTDEDIKKYGNGNYMRLIMRTSKDGKDSTVEKDSIVENVENYLEISDTGKKKSLEVDWVFFYWSVYESGPWGEAGKAYDPPMGAGVSEHTSWNAAEYNCGISQWTTVVGSNGCNNIADLCKWMAEEDPSLCGGLAQFGSLDAGGIASRFTEFQKEWTAIYKRDPDRMLELEMQRCMVEFENQLKEFGMEWVLDKPMIVQGTLYSVFNYAPYAEYAGGRPWKEVCTQSKSDEQNIRDMLENAAGINSTAGSLAHRFTGKQLELALDILDGKFTEVEKWVRTGEPAQYSL